MRNKNTFPTLLGLAVLIVGIAIGVVLVDRQQSFRTRASLSTIPKNVTISNVSESSFSVSWITDEKTAGALQWGDSPINIDETLFGAENELFNTHHFIVSGLEPSKKYYFSIISGGDKHLNGTKFWEVTTGLSIPNQPESNIISGTVKTQSGEPVERALVFISTGNSHTASALTDENGNWVSLISGLRDKSLSNFVAIDNNKTILTLFVTAGPLGFAQLSINPINAKPVPTIILGTNKVLTETRSPEQTNIPKATIILPEEATPSSGFSLER